MTRTKDGQFAVLKLITQPCAIVHASTFVLGCSSNRPHACPNILIDSLLRSV